MSQLHQHCAARKVDAAFDVRSVGAEMDRPFRPLISILRVDGQVINVVQRDIITKALLGDPCPHVEQGSFVEKAAIALYDQDEVVACMSSTIQEITHMVDESVQMPSSFPGLCSIVSRA